MFGNKNLSGHFGIPLEVKAWMAFLYWPSSIAQQTWQALAPHSLVTPSLDSSYDSTLLIHPKAKDITSTPPPDPHKNGLQCFPPVTASPSSRIGKNTSSKHKPLLPGINTCWVGRDPMECFPNHIGPGIPSPLRDISCCMSVETPETIKSKGRS